MLTPRDRADVLVPPPKPRRIVGERARRSARMLAQGVYPSRAALARGEGVSRAAVSQALRGPEPGDRLMD